MIRFNNGILLPKDVNPEQTAEAIELLMNFSEVKRAQMGVCSKKIWEERFDADKNAVEFANSLNMLKHGNTKTVVIVTEGFPYRNEISFMTREVCELIKHFDVVIITDTTLDHIKNCESQKRKIVEQLQKVIDESEHKHKFTFLLSLNSKDEKKYLPNTFRFFFDKRIVDEKRIIKQGSLRTRWESIKYYAKAVTFFDWLKKNLECDLPSEETVYYTYWHSWTTLGLCLGFKDENITIVTRTHGYDLYDERNVISHRQPYRAEMNRLLDCIYFVSKVGRDYYIKRNCLESDINIYRVSYIGSKEPEKQNDAIEESNGGFRILSCSNLISIKRVEIIIEAIKIVAQNNRLNQNGFDYIEWIHFGDGELRNKIIKLAEDLLGKFDNVKYIFMGQTDNDCVHKYYSNHKVDCFITTSSTEGLPVSIMEAMSYGIPIIATDVGGIKEVFE